MSGEPIRVQLEPPGDQPLPLDAQVRVTVEDVSLLDAPSRTVAAVQVEAGAAVPLQVEASLEPGRRYSVRVHVDRGGTGAVEVGDMVGSAPTDGLDVARVRLHPVLPEPPALGPP